MSRVFLLSVLFLWFLTNCATIGERWSHQMMSQRSVNTSGDWIMLFNGSDLEGWVKKGGEASYRVEDNAIVGTTARNSENTFLCTRSTYDDFVLELEVRLHPRLNSGIQIRSKVRDNGRVYGPQVEIESSGSDGGDAGYIYGEATGRGWLTPDEDRTPHRVFRDDDWNTYRVRAEGPRIQTWINGNAITDREHGEIYEEHSDGMICLQVHGVRDVGPFWVRWRNIRLKEL